MNANVATISPRALPFRALFLLVPILVSCGSIPSANNSATPGSTTANLTQPISSVPTVAGGFSFTGSMTSSRIAHTATMLPNGHVLIVGGGVGRDLIDGFSTVGGAELFDPSTGTFISAGTEPRDFHTATLLTNGKVLLAGGETVPPQVITASAELYDPATGLFQPTGNMTTGRESHTATLLGDGRVLMTGGIGVLQTAEIYDPASGTFSPTGSMVIPRVWHTATLLNNGSVLVTGGSTTGGQGAVAAELYDPVTGSFTPTGSMLTTHRFPTATLLPNGKVLVVGEGAELYDPATGMFTAAGPMITPRVMHSATLLTNGTVLIAGGVVKFLSNETATAEIYDPATNSFAPTGGMGSERLWHTATLLSDGSVLVTGGASSNDGIHTNALNTAEIYK